MADLFPESQMKRTAYLSKDGRYRYSLGRSWDPGNRVAAWVMLNPSTADAKKDDHTIRRCIAFSRGFGFGSLVVVNLFAYRATDPTMLLSADDPVGPGNDSYVQLELEGADMVIAAWGTVDDKLRQRGNWTIEKVIEHRGKVKCLGKTKAGAPRHPLYLPVDQELEVWL